MTAPEKIYCGNNGHGNLSYSQEKVYPSMEKYIRKNALLEWAKEMLKSCDGSVAMRRAYEKLTEHIESL